MNHTEEIKLLTQLGSDASKAALEEYTRYFIVSSAWWAFAWACGCFGIVWLWKYSANLDDPHDNMLMYTVRVVLAIVLLIFALSFASSISDLLAPRAMAIHRLLQDVRGN